MSSISIMLILGNIIFFLGFSTFVAGGINNAIDGHDTKDVVFDVSAVLVAIGIIVTIVSLIIR